MRWSLQPYVLGAAACLLRGDHEARDRRDYERGREVL